MAYISVSRLKPILDDADRRRLQNSDWFNFKMIMAFSFNKLLSCIPQLPPKTQFIKINFINQGLDFLNISNIFRDHRVTSKIPQYFENLDPPLICYEYIKLIRTIIFNYNQVTSDPDVWSSIQSSWSCADSPLLYPPAGHVVTGDFACIPDKGLGHVLRKGPSTDFHPGLILLNAGVLSRKYFILTVNDGVRRKASQCKPFTTGKMIFYALLTLGYKYFTTYSFSESTEQEHWKITQ